MNMYYFPIEFQTEHLHITNLIIISYQLNILIYKLLKDKQT